MSEPLRGEDRRQIAGVLREKYRELLRLRRGDRDGSIVDPREAMAALAARFPGALREIDRIPMAEIERRIGHLEAIARGEEAEGWVEASHRYHRLLRGALRARRWVRGRAAGAQGEREAFVEAMERSGDDEALAWAGALDEVRAPASGRLVGLVLRRLAAERGEAEARVRALLFTFGPIEPGDEPREG